MEEPKSKYAGSERIPRGVRGKLEHLEKDLEDGIIDLFTINTALFYKGYIVLLRKELPQDADTWLAEVADKTRLKLTKDILTK